MGIEVHRSIQTAGTLGLATLAIIASSKLTIDVGPIPITTQSLVVFWISVCIEPTLVLSTTVFWLILGALGASVFPDGGSGVNTLVGPNGGYWVSLVPAAVALSLAAQRGVFERFSSTLLAFSVASAGVIVGGASRLAISVGMGSAWNLGIKPFLVGTLLKALIGALAVKKLRWLVGHAREQRWAGKQPRG